jgi:menaquinone-dependent protoporphyrinogen oxidase
MKTLIAWTGKSGTTEEVVREMAGEMGEGTVSVDLKKGSMPDPSEFERVIVGGSIYAGNVHKSLKAFCDKYEEELLARPFGIFLCALSGEDMAEKLERNFPARLAAHARIKEWLGGRFIFADHNFIMRAMMKKIMKSSEDIDNIRTVEIKKFAAAMKQSGETGDV